MTQPISEQFSQAVLADLASSGLTPATIAEMGILPLSDSGKFPPISKTPDDGYLLPYHKTSKPFARRKNIPTIPGNDGKPQKYSSPYDEGTHLYILPHDWQALRSPKTSILLAEGEKVTGKLSQEARKLNVDHQKYGVVGISGVWNFCNTPEVGKITWTNREIFLAVDSDVKFNSNSVLSIFRIIGYLVRHGVPVPMLFSLVWDVNVGKGSDDFLCNQKNPHHEIVLERLIKKAESPFVVYRDKITIESGLEQIVKGAAAMLTQSQIESLLPALKKTFPSYSIPAIRRELRARLAKHAPQIEDPHTVYLGRQQQVKDKLYPDPVDVIAQNAWDIILTKDNATRYFCRDNDPIFVEKGLPHPISPRHLQSICDSLITWVVRIGDSANEIARKSAPPDIAQHMYHSAAVKALPLPPLTRIVHAPYFGKDFKLHAMPGYSKENATLYYQNGVSFDLPDVPENPSVEDVKTAKAWLHDVLYDFPFADYSHDHPWDNAEKAHAVAMMIEPFIRAWVEMTPLYLVEAPTPRTGKGLLVDVCLFPALGRFPEVSTTPSRDEEWKKMITALLSDLPTVILLDNIRRELKSEHLNSVLTSPVWKDRRLGKNDESAIFPNLATWVATGNNPKLNDEMVERTIRIRIDAPCERPSERTGFKHTHLSKYVKEHRGDLVWSILTLIQHYIAQGKPKPQKPIVKGRFELWARHIQGILECSGIYGFHQNQSTLRAFNVGNSDDLKPLIVDWLAEGEAPTSVNGVVTTDPVASRDIYELVEEDCPIELNGDSERARVNRLGTLLGRNKDRVFEINGELWKLCGTDPKRTKNRTLWYLLYIDDVENV